MAWAERAACRGIDTEVFFREADPLSVNRAKAICARCPVRKPCLNAALAGGPWVYGIWGGETRMSRRPLLEHNMLWEEV